MEEDDIKMKAKYFKDLKQTILDFKRNILNCLTTPAKMNNRAADFTRSIEKGRY